MNAQDKVLEKDTAMVLADAVVDGIAQSIPGINIAWNLSKALYGAGMKLRQERALEWVEMVRDNPSIFIDHILSDEKFQDGFVYALERYLIERDENKRRIFRNIFLGFTKAENKDKFPLEKFTHTLSQLSELDVEVLGDVKIEETGTNYQIYGANFNRIEQIYNLINLGLLLDTTGNRMGRNPEESPFVKSSILGKNLVII